MIKMPHLAALSFALAMGLAVPAAAQEGDAGPPAPPVPERINQVIVYGEDPCPAAQGDEIVVCARLEEDERYRIPPDLRQDPNDPRRESWTARVQALERVGASGTGSCSTSGLGGFTGCLGQLINDARAERAQIANANWTNAVAEQRRLRMEGLDDEARAIEEQVTRDEQARLAREEAATTEAAQAAARAAAADEEAALSAEEARGLPQPTASAPPPPR